MRFYNIDSGDNFAPFPVTLSVEPTTRTFLVKVSVESYRRWANLTGMQHLARTLDTLGEIIGNAIDLALTGAIRIQLLDVPNEKGNLLIGFAADTKARSSRDQMEDEVDGILGDLYRYQHANNGTLVRADRKIDLGLRFDPANGPIVDLYEQTNEVMDAFR